MAVVVWGRGMADSRENLLEWEGGGREDYCLCCCSPYKRRKHKCKLYIILYDHYYTHTYNVKNTKNYTNL